jgi:hypothetical protein
VLGAIWRLLLYRVLGGRLLLGLTVLGWVRRLLMSRRSSRPGSAYQPSQGESQTVQRGSP